MKQKLTDQPILLSILAILAAMPMIWLFLTPIVRLISPTFRDAIYYAGTLLVTAAFCQECYGKIPFSTENHGFFKGLFTAGAVGLICAAAAFVMSWQKPVVFPGWTPILGLVCCNAVLAFSEEYLFRGLIFTALKTRYPLVRSILICSALFGLRHLLNLFMGPFTPVATLGQVGFTFFAGIYLCAVYEVTGNLWIGFAIHFLENILTGFWGLFSGAPITDAQPLQMVLLVAVHSIYVFAGWQLLKYHKKL